MPTIIKQHTRNILHAKQRMILLGCFYFCTALITCTKHLNETSNLKKDSLPYKPLHHTNDKHIATDYNDLNKFSCELKKALQGDAGTRDHLTAKGKNIDANVAYKPGSVRVAIEQHSGGNIALILEYARKEILSCKTQPKETSVTLMVASYKDATDTPAYIELMKRLLKYKVDLNGLNRWGETPLTEVIQHRDDQNRINLIEMLLKAGASPNAVNRKQQVPLGMINQIKKAEDREKIVKLLIEHGANPLLAQMDQATQAYVREMVIGQLEKINLTLQSPNFHETLTQLDTKLSLFFNQKYSRSDAVLVKKEDQTCVLCAKKEREATTIRLPSCGHYVHGSCLAQSLIDMKYKGRIKWMPRPSYLYIHLCPCCKKDIARDRCDRHQALT